ncbi:hypothetical protein DL95DRAFT_390826 [Leptodontidium sp. 2 PMI_412]|nr:hypothetical protein DL95DRAFT_390826 [Leptodontidium sp. 2 PMI_412]
MSFEVSLVWLFCMLCSKPSARLISRLACKYDVASCNKCPKICPISGKVSVVRLSADDMCRNLDSTTTPINFLSALWKDNKGIKYCHNKLWI